MWRVPVSVVRLGKICRPGKENAQNRSQDGRSSQDGNGIPQDGNDIPQYGNGIPQDGTRSWSSERPEAP